MGGYVGSTIELDDMDKILLPPLAYETRTVLADQPELESKDCQPRMKSRRISIILCDNCWFEGPSAFYKESQVTTRNTCFVRHLRKISKSDY